MVSGYPVREGINCILCVSVLYFYLYLTPVGLGTQSYKKKGKKVEIFPKGVFVEMCFSIGTLEKYQTLKDCFFSFLREEEAEEYLIRPCIGNLIYDGKLNFFSTDA